MSFREKSIWTCLLSILVIYPLYFVQAFRLYREGRADSVGLLLVFAGAVVAQSVVLIVAHTIFAIQSKPEDADERDIAIELRSLKYSHIALSLGVFLAIFSLIARQVIYEGGGPLMQVTPFFVGHALLFFFVIAEILNYGTQVFYYRRGA